MEGFKSFVEVARSQEPEARVSLGCVVFNCLVFNDLKIYFLAFGYWLLAFGSFYGVEGFKSFVKVARSQEPAARVSLGCVVFYCSGFNDLKIYFLAFGYWLLAFGSFYGVEGFMSFVQVARSQRPE